MGLEASGRRVVIDHRKTAKAKAKLISTDLEKKTSIVQLTIHEGGITKLRKCSWRLAIRCKNYTAIATLSYQSMMCNLENGAP